MIKLLRANMARLLKSATFWICMSLYALYPIIVTLIEKDTYEPITSDRLLALNYGVEWFPMQGVFIAILCSIIFSTDFHNGTLKNKIIMGHSRSNIYLANLLTTMIMSLALSVIYILIVFILGMPILGKFTSSASTIIWMLVNGALMLMTYSSIMTFIVMNSKNSTASIIISALILTAGALLAYIAYHYASMPPYVMSFMEDEFGNTIYDEHGRVIWIEIPNPELPSKTVRDFCQFLIDFFPSGQSSQISREGAYTHGWQMMLYSLGLIPAITSAGTAIFKKANIK
ncbi:MAG: ABC transporter permease [Clostridia bacterium]|nr:ABC transporter permease [Clostridia bacterium]